MEVGDGGRTARRGKYEPMEARGTRLRQRIKPRMEGDKRSRSASPVDEPSREGGREPGESFSCESGMDGRPVRDWVSRLTQPRSCCGLCMERERERV